MLIAKQVALELVRELRPIVPVIRKFDRNLAQQLVDAVNSTVQNLSEGECHSGGNKRLKYEIALGEANEAKGSLELAVAWGWIDEDVTARRVVGRLVAMCWGLAGKNRTDVAAGRTVRPRLRSTRSRPPLDSSSE